MWGGVWRGVRDTMQTASRSQTSTDALSDYTHARTHNTGEWMIGMGYDTLKSSSGTFPGEDEFSCAQRLLLCSHTCDISVRRL